MKTSVLLKRLVPPVAVGTVLAYSLFFRATVPLSISLVACGYGNGSGTCGWMNLGGILGSGPEVTSSGLNNLGVFVQGQDRQLWYRTSGDGGSTFTGWAPLGGIMIGSPGAATQDNGQIDVFVRGQDNQLWQKEFTTASGWGGWAPLGGILISAPDAASRGPGLLDVFGVGQDHQLWQKSFSAGAWGGWSPLGGSLTGKPGATSDAACCASIDVFGRGQDNQLWEKSFFGSPPTWHGWKPLGGILKDGTGPDVDTRVEQGGFGKHDVFIEGQDNQLWQRSSNSTIWGPWQPEGGVLTAEPGGAFVGNSNAVFVRGQDNALYWSPVTSTP